MAIADSLFQQAQNIAMHQQQRMAGLEEEIRNLETELIQKKAALNSCRLSIQRLSKFVPQVGANLYCPRCFMENELSAALDPSRGDFVNCKSCGSEFAV